MAEAGAPWPGRGAQALGPGGTADPAGLVAAARDGDPRALARLVSLVENGSPRLREIMKLIAPLTGQARIIGLTGAPGVGKSTVTGALVRVYRGEGLRVGVLAVDPTSPFSQALRILDAAGFDVIMIATLGVGQAEVAIASLADSTLVIVAPGMGDSVQAAKAGILEIADIFVVNKSDRPGAQEAVRDLRTMLAMAGYGPGEWKPPIVSATAVRGEGIDDLVGRLQAHGAWLGESGERDRRRLARASEEISAIAVAALRERIGVLPGESQLEDLAGQVAAGKLDPYAAADELIGG